MKPLFLLCSYSNTEQGELHNLIEWYYLQSGVEFCDANYAFGTKFEWGLGLSLGCHVSLTEATSFSIITITILQQYAISKRKLQLENARKAKK